MSTFGELTVGDACHLDLSPPIIVGPDEDFAEIIRRFAIRADLRGIFVADAEGHLLGVITRSDLLDWARIKLGAALQAPLRDLDKTLRLVSLMRASTAGEVMHPHSQRAAVRPDDPLAHALRLMIELDLIVLPVVDENNRIIGDLKLAEVLAKAAEL
jgi:CBS domain-containing protein